MFKSQINVICFCIYCYLFVFDISRTRFGILVVLSNEGHSWCRKFCFFFVFFFNLKMRRHRLQMPREPQGGKKPLKKRKINSGCALPNPHRAALAASSRACARGGKLQDGCKCQFSSCTQIVSLFLVALVCLLPPGYGSLPASRPAASLGRALGSAQRCDGALHPGNEAAH